MGSNSTATGVSDSISPIVRKNQWRGLLFKYGPKPIQVREFNSIDANENSKFFFLGFWVRVVRTLNLNWVHDLV